MKRRHHAPVVRTDRIAGTPRSADAAPANQPRPPPRCVGVAQSVARPGDRLRAGHTRPSQPRLCGPMRHGSSARPSERAVLRRRAGGVRRVTTRPRPDDRRRPRRASVVDAGGESSYILHRERGRAPASGGAKVVVARADAAHVRGGRVGVCSLWRSHACGGHHRGPRRHPRILNHLGLPTEAPAPRPPPSDLFDWS